MTESLLAELEGLLGSRSEARWILEELGGTGAEGAPIDARAGALELAERRRGGEPLQYLLGHWPFRGLDLLVDPRALIPRPETEQLVEVGLQLAPSAPRAVAVDLGCGTGAIALSLAKEAGFEVHAVDVSQDALGLARQNARRARVRGVTFHHGSWYDALPDALRGELGLVCSNPPYVARTQLGQLQRELGFEPALALFAEDSDDGVEGFAAVEGVVRGAIRWLAPGGWLVVEHGSGHRDAALRCAAQSGLVCVEDRDDLAGLPRVLVARKPG